MGKIGKVIAGVALIGLSFVGLPFGLAALSGTFLGMGASLVLGGIAEMLTPGPKPGSVGGTSEQISLDPTHPREVAVGQPPTPGSLLDKFSHDHLPWGGGNEGKNRVKEVLICLADHECDGLIEIWDGARKLTLGTEDAALGWPIAEYNSEGKDHLYIKFHKGTWDQVADQHLIDVSGGEYTASDRGVGVCYARVTMVASIDQDDKAWAAGEPQLKFVLRGAKLYDPRKDSSVGGSGSHRWGDLSTYEWTDNAAVIEYNLIRGIDRGDGELLYGVEASHDQVRFDDAAAAINACDEDVALKGGGTEKRYKASGIIQVSAEVRTALDAIRQSMAGAVYTLAGSWRIFAGVAQAPAISFTDADVMLAEDYSAKPKLPSTDLINTVYASYIDPASGYTQQSIPVRRSTDDVTTDGGIGRKLELQLDFVYSATQAQRVAEIERRKGRRQIRHTRTLPPYAYEMEAGDWGAWTSARYGYAAKAFEIANVTINGKLDIGLQLKETDATIYDWNAATDQADKIPVNLPSADPPAALKPTGFNVNPINQTGSGGTSVPILPVTWDPPNTADVTGVTIEWRKVGSIDVHSVSAADANEGVASIRALIMPDVAYEARMKFNAVPTRATDWTDWEPFSFTSGPVFQAGADPATTALLQALSDSVTVRSAVQALANFTWRETLDKLAGAALQTIADLQVTQAIVRDATIERLPDGSVHVHSIDAIKATLGDWNASVSTIADALVDVQGRTSAYWQMSVDAGGTAFMRAQADNAGSTIMIAADTIGLYNSADNSVVPALAVVDGDVYVANNLFVGTDLMLGRYPGIVRYDNGSVAFALGGPFGASNDLMFYIGPSMALGAMSRDNASMWVDVAGNGRVSGTWTSGGGEHSAKSNSTVDSPVVETEVWTPANANITVTYSYQRFGSQITYASSGTEVNNSGALTGGGLELYRSINGGAYSLVDSGAIPGGWSLMTYFDFEDPNAPSGQKWVTRKAESCSLSRTYVDTVGGTQSRQFKAVVSGGLNKTYHYPLSDFAQTKVSAQQ